MGIWYVGILIGYGICVLWALSNFKKEINAIKIAWDNIKQYDPGKIIMASSIRDVYCWILMIAIVAFGATGIGVGISLILAVVLMFRIVCKVKLPAFGEFTHSSVMFALDVFITTGGLGLVPLGAVIGVAGGGLAAGFITVMISNIMSHMFFLPKKEKEEPCTQ